jgi:prepilin-type N-terminal cleavage/methylation domain-containing protein
MFNKLKKDNQGFTIIEVLIVLAIAGLIMLIVFLAVPALQRNQRNNARNNEASRISAALTECLANRNGQVASCDTSGDINVGTLQQLSVPATFSDNASTDLGTGSTTAVVVGFQRQCTTDGSNDQAGSSRDFAVMYQLEPAVNRCIGSQAN